MPATCWVQELLDPKKATYPLMYESGAEYSWDGSSENLKDELLGFMDVNDLAESSFAGFTDQLQVFGRNGMESTAAIRYMDRNGFLDRPTTNNEKSDKKKVCFIISRGVSDHCHYVCRIGISSYKTVEKICYGWIA